MSNAEQQAGSTQPDPWERLYTGSGGNTRRMPVANGYLYLHIGGAGSAMAFVPDDSRMFSMQADYNRLRRLVERLDPTHIRSMDPENTTQVLARCYAHPADPAGSAS